MIASLGGAQVAPDGSRNYAGAGGAVGGLSFDGGNWSVFTGAGKAYERFTPYQVNYFRAAEEIGAGLDNPVDSTQNNTTGGAGGSTVSTTPPFQSSTGGLSLPHLSGGYRGYAGIQQGGNIVTSALNSIFGAYQSGAISMQEALLNAQLYSGYLSNPNYFYQAQHGSDASLLVRLKMQAASIINSIQNWVAPVSDGGIKSDPTVKNTKNPTEVPIDIPPSLLDLIKGLGASAKTSVEAPPTLFNFTPTGAQSGGGSNTMRNLVLLGVVGVIGWYVWKRFA